MCVWLCVRACVAACVHVRVYVRACVRRCVGVGELWRQRGFLCHTFNCIQLFVDPQTFLVVVYIYQL